MNVAKHILIIGTFHVSKIRFLKLKLVSWSFSKHVFLYLYLKSSQVKRCDLTLVCFNNHWFHMVSWNHILNKRFWVFSYNFCSLNCVQVSVVLFLFFTIQGSYNVTICTLVQHFQQRNQNMSNTQIYETCAQWKVVFLYSPTYAFVGMYPKHNKYWNIYINFYYGSVPIIHKDLYISVKNHWEEHKKTWHIMKCTLNNNNST